MATADEVAKVVLVGIGATLVMDGWTVVLKALGAPTLNYALVGRWAGHLLRGRLSHPGIGKAAPIRGELPLGWAIHYAVGIAFAAALVILCGAGWLRDPTWRAALARGHGDGDISLVRHAASDGCGHCRIAHARAAEELPAQPGDTCGFWVRSLSVGRRARADLGVAAARLDRLALSLLLPGEPLSHDTNVSRHEQTSFVGKGLNQVIGDRPDR